MFGNHPHQGRPPGKREDSCRQGDRCATYRRRPAIGMMAGAAGLLLPRLESFARDGDDHGPRRFVTLFFPNGVYPDAWQAEAGKDGLEFGGSLAPLARHASTATLIRGLDNPLGGHLGQTSGFLSGHDFMPDDRGVVHGRRSLDQILAGHIGGETFLPALNLAMEPPSQGGFGNRPRSFGNSISWQSDTNKVEPTINPQQAFDLVFHGQTQPGRDAAERRRRIVDQVWSQAKTLHREVSSADRQRLGQYIDSIDQLQSKLRKTVELERAEWPRGTDPQDNRPRSSGIPGDYTEHMRQMMDIMLLALQTDSTRVATLVMGHSISRVVYDFVSPAIKRNHHDLSHHRNDPEKIKQYNAVTAWFAKQADYFLQRMSEIDEGDGTMLDRSVVLYGSGMKDGNVHEPKDVPVTLFGGAGGRLKGGQMIRCSDGALLAQLHLSLLRLFGIEADDFNGVTEVGVPGLV